MTEVRLSNEAIEMANAEAERWELTMASVIRRALRWARRSGVGSTANSETATREESQPRTIDFQGLDVPTGPALNWIIRQFCELQRNPQPKPFQTDMIEDRDYTVKEATR